MRQHKRAKSKKIGRPPSKLPNAVHDKNRQADPTKLPEPDGPSPEECFRWAWRMCAIVLWEYAQISEQPEQRPRSVDDLHFVIKLLHRKARGIDVSVKKLEEKVAAEIGDIFLGFTVRRRGKDTLILLNPLPDPAYRRFGFVQESFHVLLDHPDFRTINLKDAIGDYLIRARVRKFKNAFGSTLAEFAAEIAAMEALFPFAERLRYARRLQALRQQAGSRAKVKALIDKISARYGVPQPWIKLYLQKGVMARMKKLHDET